MRTWRSIADHPAQPNYRNTNGNGRSVLSVVGDLAEAEMPACSPTCATSMPPPRPASSARPTAPADSAKLFSTIAAFDEIAANLS